MITLGIPIILIVLMGYANRDQWKYDREGLVFFSIIMLLVLWLFMNIPTIFFVKKVHNSRSVPIVSIRTNSEIKGSFFLGTGQLDSEECYVAMQDMGNNKAQLILELFFA